MNAKKFAAKKPSGRIKKMADGGGLGSGFASGFQVGPAAGPAMSPPVGRTQAQMSNIMNAVPMGGMARTPGPAQMGNLPPNMTALAGGLGNLGGMNRFRGMGPMAAGMGNIPGGGGLRTMAKGGSVENPKMSKKVAGYFAKKGEKGLAAHERREAAGKEKDTPAIAKREERALRGAPAGLKKYEKEEHAEMGMKRGGMACGGMKKYARGGGVESKGKTKGTFVKMASGGSVSARADGIASRGKTKCKIC